MCEWGEDGYLEIILGPMFSGKTSTLITIKRRYEVCDVSCCIINHIDDKRYHDTLLATHDLQMVKSMNIKKLKILCNGEMVKRFDVFLINEGQFFEDLFETIIELVEKHKKKVYVCGLNGDYKRDKFGTIVDLIPYCNSLKKLNALCKLCKNGKKGIFTHRVSSEKNQKQIGSDNYMPLCRKCYLEKNLN